MAAFTADPTNIRTSGDDSVMQIGAHRDITRKLCMISSDGVELNICWEKICWVSFCKRGDTFDRVVASRCRDVIVQRTKSKRGVFSSRIGGKFSQGLYFLSKLT